MSTPTLPVLYTALEPLDAERHAALRLRDVGHGFAAHLSSIPLAVEEFALAGRHMPVVFAAAAPHMPVALTGLAPDRNLFVDEKGGWRRGTYVPAYLRRYPFLLVRAAADSDQLVLCIDPQAPQFATTAGEPLFEAEKKPAPLASKALDFTRSVEAAFRKTQEFAEGLSLMGLLQPAATQFEWEGKPFRVDGFHAVDRERMAQLTGEQLATLRDKGWLDAIYAHLLSLGGIPELKQMQG
ncbi:SapC family protein [Roseococcus sp. SDR]|uniref:SapC family protein n=1 Tax=Roseococcus sp. SDR TaxID=2835532 RepID=UPI001BCAC7AB|nr:SapC family protein [Roseococcus sp. SDR]MBS7792412.1 SapC family protein [Roseococcus sp. SDR]MBV1847726.1 SapC family protein [Roseococcus sp. SDR]